MEVIPFKLGEEPAKKAHLSLCLGTFDGLHRGHQELFFLAKKTSEGPVGVLLFDGNPALYFPSGKSAKILTATSDKLALLQKWGIDVVYQVAISPEFFALSKEDFLSQVLAKIAPERLVVGADYRYGRGAEGDLALLQKHYPVDVVPLLRRGSKKISTQNIIQELLAGKISEANADLGRLYEIKGTIAHGLGNGRKMGFPTANLHLSADYVLPRNGVYFGVAYLRGLPYQALINIGTNPTIGVLREPLVECYLEGFQGDAYGETLYLDFAYFERAEKKFPSLDALKRQLLQDQATLHQGLWKRSLGAAKEDSN